MVTDFAPKEDVSISLLDDRRGHPLKLLAVNRKPLSGHGVLVKAEIEGGKRETHRLRSTASSRGHRRTAFFPRRLRRAARSRACERHSEQR